MSNNDARQTFAQETAELLDEMEDALLSLEQQPSDSELLNSVFRAMHTIKGAAGVFGFDPIVEFTHPVETVMDSVRNGEREMDAELVAVLLKCKDHTADLTDQVLAGEDLAMPEDLAAYGKELLRQLRGESGNTAASAGELTDSVADVQKEQGPDTSGDHWLISLHFGQDALRNGMDPLSFIRYLKTLGDIVELVTLTQDIPEAEKMDPESCYLGFRILFHSDASKQAIEDVFEFAQDDCEIRILPPNSAVEHYLESLEDLPVEETQRLGELLVEIGAVTQRELKSCLDTQQQASTTPDDAARPLGEILVEQQVTKQPLVDKALEKQQKGREHASQEAKFIRVDATRLGHLINLVGELVISSAAMKVQASKHGLADVEEVVEGMEHLVEEIRDNALQLRMVPIGDTFSRFRRVVRDVSKELGKDIELTITGGESELDKTVVEKINDPLTHLVRNALDHGIESPQTREDAGKPGTGNLYLNAFHDSGHIVIQVKDDGAGLDPDRIRAKAEAIGLVSPEQTLSRSETLRLIFEPGLSTKQQASDLSGRGVGMDVVKRNIEALRGTVDLDSEPGKGTTVTIHLPLTLAIIDGFMVGSGEERYIIPLSMVEECVEMDSGEIDMENTRNYVNLRGEVLPYLRLGEYFELFDKGPRDGRESLVVVRFGRHKAGFVVDELFGESQTVIKPMGKIFSQLKGISGATVLGTGDIALILDVQKLIDQVARQQRGRSAVVELVHAS